MGHINIQVTAAGAVDRGFVYIEGPEEAQGGPGRPKEAQEGTKDGPRRSQGVPHEIKESSGRPRDPK